MCDAQIYLVLLDPQPLQVTTKMTSEQRLCTSDHIKRWTAIKFFIKQCCLRPDFEELAYSNLCSFHPEENESRRRRRIIECREWIDVDCIEYVYPIIRFSDEDLMNFELSMKRGFRSSRLTIMATKTPNQQYALEMLKLMEALINLVFPEYSDFVNFYIYKKNSLKKLKAHFRLEGFSSCSAIMRSVAIFLIIELSNMMYHTPGIDLKSLYTDLLSAGDIPIQICCDSCKEFRVSTLLLNCLEHEISHVSATEGERKLIRSYVDALPCSPCSKCSINDWCFSCKKDICRCGSNFLMKKFQILNEIYFRVHSAASENIFETWINYMSSYFEELKEMFSVQLPKVQFRMQINSGCVLLMNKSSCHPEPDIDVAITFDVDESTTHASLNGVQLDYMHLYSDAQVMRDQIIDFNSFFLYCMRIYLCGYNWLHQNMGKLFCIFIKQEIINITDATLRGKVSSWSNLVIHTNNYFVKQPLLLSSISKDLVCIKTPPLSSKCIDYFFSNCFLSKRFIQMKVPNSLSSNPNSFNRIVNNVAQLILLTDLEMLENSMMNKKGSIEQIRLCTVCFEAQAKVLLTTCKHLPWCCMCFLNMLLRLERNNQNVISSVLFGFQTSPIRCPLCREIENKEYFLVLFPIKYYSDLTLSCVYDSCSNTPCYVEKKSHVLKYCETCLLKGTIDKKQFIKIY